MNRCPKCRCVLIRASSYDQDGAIALQGGFKEKDKNGVLQEWWICLNGNCEDGKQNKLREYLKG